MREGGEGGERERGRERGREGGRGREGEGGREGGRERSKMREGGGGGGGEREREGREPNAFNITITIVSTDIDIQYILKVSEPKVCLSFAIFCVKTRFAF